MSSKVAALFVDAKGIYPKLLGADAYWDEKRDARLYLGPDPVVAHPPCARWSRMAESVAARFPGRPDRQVGADSGCFRSALNSVCRFGGVLEHPASTKAWAAHGIPRPSSKCGWLRIGKHAWTCEVHQVAYGHEATKATWLLYIGIRVPFELDWSSPHPTATVGKASASWIGLREMTKAERSATPVAFAQVLVRLARWSRG